MTRILSVFNLMKRVGFAVLLLGIVFGSNTEAQAWRQIPLAQAELSIGWPEIVSDSLGNLHVYYTEADEREPNFPFRSRSLLKFMYLSGTGEIIFGPIVLSPFVDHPGAAMPCVTSDKMTRSWCVWSDSLIEPEPGKGLYLSGFNGIDQTITPPTPLGPDPRSISGSASVLDVTYRWQDETLHFVDARFFAYYSKFTANGEVLVWEQPIDSVNITERVVIDTAPEGSVWAVIRNEIPGYVESLFVRFLENGNMDVQHPFGTGQEHYSAVSAMTFSPDGRCHLIAAFDTNWTRYCRLDNAFEIEEWRHLQVESLIGHTSIAANPLNEAFMVWEETVVESHLFASEYSADEGWISEGELVSALPRRISYMSITPIGEENWAIVTSSGSPPNTPVTLNLFVDNISSIETEYGDIDVNPQIYAYPNPSNGSFQITSTFSRVPELYVFDILGRLVQKSNQASSGSQTVINLSTLPSGVYFVVSQRLENTPIKLYLQR